MNKLRVLELFGGISSFSKGLQRAGVPYEIVDYVDIDKYAVQAFNAIHDTHYEPQDICEWNKDIEVDMICHGSPCQSFSVAGLGHGGDKGSGTRSSLMWETVRIVEKLKPKYVCWENVKGLLAKKHKHNFDLYLKTLEDLGYNNYYQVLNAKDYLIPQNRERVFTVSILKDIDDGKFEFPVKTLLTKRLKDILEPNVDEKYYLSEERLAKIKLWDTRQRENGRGFRFDVKNGNDVARTVTTSSDRPAETTYVKDELKQVAQIYGFGKEPNPQAGRVYDKEGVSPTLDTCSGGNRMPKVAEPKLDFVGGYGDTDRVGDGKKLSRNYPQGNRVYSTEGLAAAQTADGGGLGGKTGLYAEPFIAASRGRPAEGGKTEQHLEPHRDGVSNTLTSVEKDNYVVEPQPIKRRRSELGKKLRKAYENHEVPANENMRESYIGNDGVMPTLTCSKREQKIAEPQIIDPQGRLEKVNKPKDLAPTLRAESHGNEPCIIEHNKFPKHQQDLVQDSEGLCRTILAGTHGSTPHLLKTQVSPYRIRRLTAKECWRLMNRDDWEFDKAEKAGVSQTQLYKIAGNSIVAACPTAIFSQLFCDRKWNQMTIAEREALVYAPKQG